MPAEPQQFRNLGLVGVTPEEGWPESSVFGRSSIKETLAGHFPRGVKSLGSLEVGGIPQDSSGWQMGSGEQGPPPKTRLREGGTVLAGARQLEVLWGAGSWNRLPPAVLGVGQSRVEFGG